MNMNHYLGWGALLYLAAAQAADSYGYLAFWQHPDKPEVVTVTKTTQEGAGKSAARAELRAFCRSQDQALGGRRGASGGCLSITLLRNSCAAAAWPQTKGLLKHDNVVVVRDKKSERAAQKALQLCESKYGVTADCALETVFCTSADQYGGDSESIVKKHHL